MSKKKKNLNPKGDANAIINQQTDSKLSLNDGYFGKIQPAFHTTSK